MGIFDKCLLACDIDGTLMASGYINPKNIERIEYFVKEGGIFSLSTGRSVMSVSDITEKFDCIGPSVLANGCMIYDYRNSRIMYSISLPSNTGQALKDILSLKDIDFGIEVHCGENSYTLKRNKMVNNHQIYEKFESPDITFEDVCKSEWNKVLVAFNCEEDRKKARDLLDTEIYDCRFIDTCTIIYDITNYYLEIIPNGISKATALKKICEMLSIRENGLFAIGDYYNDLEMIKSADIGAFTKDSPEELKRQADYITCNCKDGAVADFIDYLSNLLQKR